jgi:uncharacterized protein with HEPN domain
MQRDVVTLGDVYIAITHIQSFVDGMSKDEFLQDRKTQSAVLHQLMIIGEAIKRLSPDFRQSHLDINWKEYAGFRDVLIHQYDNVNLEWVWDGINDELVELFNRVDRILPESPL